MLFRSMYKEHFQEPRAPVDFAEPEETHAPVVAASSSLIRIYLTARCTSTVHITLLDYFFVALGVPWFQEKEESRCACWKVPAQLVGSNWVLLATSHMTPQWRGVQVSGQ